MQRQIEDAIKCSVKRHGQAPELANKIIAWMKALASGNEQIDDGQRALQRVGVLYDATVVSDGGERT